MQNSYSHFGGQLATSYRTRSMLNRYTTVIYLGIYLRVKIFQHVHFCMEDYPRLICNFKNFNASPMMGKLIYKHGTSKSAILFNAKKISYKA
jgi:hypothetical protein